MQAAPLLLHPCCCTPPTSRLPLSLLLHPSYIPSTAFLPHCILPAWLPLSQAEPGRGEFCASREGPRGATVPGCWLWREGDKAPSPAAAGSGEQRQHRRGACTGESFLLPVAAPQGLLFSSGINPEKPNIKQSFKISLSRCFCFQNSDTMTAALVSKSSPEPGTTWTSQIPAIPEPILSLQQDSFFFFFFLSWCVHNGMKPEKAGILALRNSRKNTVQRPQVLPGSGMREFQMSNLLSFTAAEGALPSRRRCHCFGFGLSVPTDFSKWQKYAFKPQPLAASAAQINTLVIA